MMISSSYVLWHFIRGLGTLRLHWRNLAPRPRMLARIVSIGLSPACVQIAAGAINIAANHCFNAYSPTLAEANEGIACWSIALSVNFIFITPVFGLAQGMQPIVGYNLGARNWARVRQTYKTALLSGIALCCAGAAIIGTCAPWLVLCFNQSPQIVDTGTRALRIIITVFPLIAIDILTVNYFQATGRAWVSICLSLLRQVIFFLPTLVVLSHLTGIRNIWWSIPVSDTAALLCSSTIATCTLARLARRERAQDCGSGNTIPS